MSLKETFLVSPLSVRGCQLWLDAADTSKMSISGSNVLSITDKSPSSLVFSASATRPVRSSTTYNGFSPIQFNGTSFLLNSTFSYTLNSRSAFIVAGETTLGNNNGVLSFATSGTDFNSTSAMAYETGNKPVNQMFQAVSAFGAGGYAISVVGSIATPFAVYGETFGSGTAVLYSNGTQAGTASSGQVFTNSTGLYLGARMVGGSVGNYLTGVIAEVILYNRPLTASERQKIEGYLAWKWGLTGSLPSTHPFKNYRPINGLSVPIPISYTNPKKTVNLDPFDPRSISGCQLWFDASDPNANRTLLSDGVGVATWTDKSSNAYTVSQTTSGNRPIFRTAVQNNLPGIQFQTNTFLSNLSVNMPRFTQGGGAGSVFIAARNASTNAGWNIVNTVWFDSGGGDSAALRRYHFSFNQASTAGTTLYVNNGASIALVGQDTGNAVSPNANAILGFTISPSSATINTNGNSVSYTGFALQDITNNTGLFIFGDNRNNSSIASNIMIFEMVGYNTQLTTAQRQQVEGYLAWKWGLTSSLPANHPYRTPIAPFPPVSIPRKGGERFFNPRTISGIQLWLDAADVGNLTVAGSTVSQINDKSGNGYNATQTTAGSRPTLSTTKLVQFANNTYLDFPQAAINNTTRYALFLVFNPIASVNWILQKQFNGVGSYNMLSMTNFWQNNTGVTNYLYWAPHANTGVVNSGTALSLNTLQLIEVLYDGTTLSFYRNGTLLNTATSGPTLSIVNQTSATNCTIGSWRPDGGIQNSGVTNFLLGELVYHNVAFTTNQRQVMEGYLAWKWGLVGSLPSMHPFKLFPPSP
jgi:hypothetical protein